MASSDRSERHPTEIAGLLGECLREVRERWPETVRIVISGYTDSEDIIAGINEAGIYQYILKPWAPDHLLDSVRNAVETQALQQFKAGETTPALESIRNATLYLQR